MKPLKTSFTIFIAMLFIAPAAQAETKALSQRLKNCKAITSMITRAQCYDKVVSDFDIENLNRLDVGKGAGKWVVTSEASPLTGDKNVYANISGDDYVKNAQGKFNLPSLVLRCMEKKMEGYIIWDDVLGKDDVLINWRVGEGETEAARWALSADKLASFIPDAKAFTKSLLGNEKMAIKAWVGFADPLLTTFDLRGVDTALQPMLEACDVR